MIFTMLSLRLASSSARFISKSGVNKLVGSTAAFRANVNLPWDVVHEAHNNGATPFTIEDLHKKKFVHPGGPHALTSAPTGAYVAVTDEDIKSIPEGFAGDLDNEFLFVGGQNKSWMIRDAGKLVCNLLDDFKGRKNDDLGGARAGRHYAKLEVPFAGLTDRAEWHDAVMNVEHYGKSLLNLPKNSLKAAGSRNLTFSGMDLVADTLSAIKEQVKEFPDRIMLAGARGVGKSVALNQAVLHARRNGWLVLFIPNGWEHAQLGSYVQPCLLEGQPFESTISFKSNNKVVTNEDELEEIDLPAEIATDAKTIFDNHELSAEALRGFFLAHGAQLKDIPIRDTKILDKYKSYRADFNEAMERILSVQTNPEGVPFLQLRAMIEGSDAVPHLDKLDAPVLQGFKYLEFEAATLADLCVYGVAFRQLAGSLFIDLVNELREYDNPEMPVLVAVDQFNNWEVPSAFAYNDQRLAAKQLCVPHALNFLSVRKTDSDHWGLKNGMAIGTSCSKYLEGLKSTYQQHKKSLPLCVTVPFYSNKEYLSALAYYTHHNIFAPNLQVQDLLALRTFTSSNPRLLRADGLDFVLPIAMEYSHDATAAEAQAEMMAEANSSKRLLEDARLRTQGISADDMDEEDEEEEVVITPANKKAVMAAQKAKLEAEKAAEAERSAKQAADEARLSQKFDKVRVNAYLSNKDKKFLKMRDGRA